MKRAVQLRKERELELAITRSKNRLNDSINKKFRTTFIGALSIFEDMFGHLWGNRLPKYKLNAEQLEFRRIWEEARTLILNNGNNQLRASQNEISEYDIEWNRYQTIFQKREG